MSRPRIRDIVRATCERLDLDEHHVLSPRRYPRLVYARDLICYVAEKQDHSHGVIAQALKRHRSAVRRSSERIRDFIKSREPVTVEDAAQVERRAIRLSERHYAGFQRQTHDLRRTA